MNQGESNTLNMCRHKRHKFRIHRHKRQNSTDWWNHIGILCSTDGTNHMWHIEHKLRMCRHNQHNWHNRHAPTRQTIDFNHSCVASFPVSGFFSQRSSNFTSLWLLTQKRHKRHKFRMCRHKKQNSADCLST